MSSIHLEHFPIYLRLKIGLRFNFTWMEKPSLQATILENPLAHGLKPFCHVQIAKIDLERRQR